MESNFEAYKLMPIEAWRLMGFTDEDFRKAEKAMDYKDARLYKQAGNSIVVNVLEEIFKMMM